MKPIEIKLNREFKKLQKELEDYWFTEGSDKISEFADEIARKKYLEIHNITEDIKNLINVENFNDVYEYIFKLNDLLDKLQISVNNFKDYLESDMNGGFQKELFEVASGKSKEIIEEIKKLEATAYYFNLQKLANTIHCRTWQSMGRMTFVLNTVCDEILPHYKKAINKEIIEVQELLNKKVSKVKEEFFKKEINTKDKTDIKKIFDYKKMNEFIKMKGFEPVRQTGDHKIYSKNGKSIPIPQHELGKGLSCKIQKQIS